MSFQVARIFNSSTNINVIKHRVDSYAVLMLLSYFDIFLWSLYQNREIKGKYFHI